VKQALRGMKNLPGIYAKILFQVLQQVFKICRRRLVRADVLSGVNRIKADTELTGGGSKTLPVYR
jgi:hypothetical protein